MHEPIRGLSIVCRSYSRPLTPAPRLALQNHLSTPRHRRYHPENVQPAPNTWMPSQSAPFAKLSPSPYAWGSAAHPSLLHQPESSTGKRKLPGEWVDEDNANASTYDPFHGHPQHNPSAETEQEAVPGMEYYREYGIDPQMGPDSPAYQPGLLHRAANHVLGAVSAIGAPVVHQAQEVMHHLQKNWTQYDQHHGTNGNDFGLNYDEEGLVGRLDRGGPDGEKRCALIACHSS